MSAWSLGITLGDLLLDLSWIGALLFIALSLRRPDGRSAKTPVLFGLLHIHTYLVQALLGMAVAFALIATLMPDLFPGIGFLMAYGVGDGARAPGHPPG